jgi:two-component system, sensor histidine kinase and response regulator
MGRISHQAYDLLENLLEWYKVQTGQIVAQKYDHSLKAIAEEVIDLFDDAAMLKGISLCHTIDEAIIVKIDKDITKAIIRNLVNNAIKFTNNEGRVTIAAQMKGDKVEVVVSDTGTGIAGNMIPGLFAMSSDKSTPGTAEEKGSGLGLNICKELVTILGGQIWVKSEMGKGSSFYFTIPVGKKGDG